MIKDDYTRHTSKKIKVILLLTIMLMLLSIISLSVGSYKMTLKEVVLGILNRSENSQHFLVIYKMRLPRVLAAIICGAGLSVAGCIMQVTLKNPLASPSTLGIASAATFGANLSIIVFGTGQFLSNQNAALLINNPYLTTVFAFFFSMLTVFCILSLSKLKGFTPQSIILAGVALSAFFTALTTVLQYFADEAKLSSAIFWTFGDLGRVNYHEILIMFIVIALSILYFNRHKLDYNALSCGNEVAHSLGVKVEKVRYISLLLSSLITATVVSFLGMIGFIGLLGPHMMRRVVGEDHRFLIPCSIVFGSLLLVGADLISRTIISPILLPVGSITSLIGAPLFLYILFRSEKKYVH